MIEHVMAALAGSQIDNCRIEIDAPECPGCDGSSQAFVEASTAPGSSSRTGRARPWSSSGPFTVREGDAILAAHPGSGDSLTLSYHLDYGPDSAIGNQSFLVDVSPTAFRRELAGSRTFLLEAEARRLAGRRHRHRGPPRPTS